MVVFDEHYRAIKEEPEKKRRLLAREFPTLPLWHPPQPLMLLPLLLFLFRTKPL